MPATAPDRLGAALAYQPKANVKPGYLYVIRCQRYYKIGWTENPKARVSAYQVHNPYPIRLVGTVQGTRQDERAWHMEFRGVHVRGEWYRLARADAQRVLTEAAPAAPLVRLRA